MGNQLFGVDIAGIIATAVAPGLLPATLTQFAPGAQPTRRTEAPPQVATAHSCRGIWEDYDPDMVRDSALILAGDRKALLIGDTLPAGVVPKQGDTITIEGITLVVIRMESRDPAAATYLVQCRDKAGVNGT
jgi:hypothetical protein